MASSPFCQLMKHLTDIEPALSTKKLPTLHAFALLGKEFKAQERETSLVELSKAVPNPEPVSSPTKAAANPAADSLNPTRKDQVSCQNKSDPAAS